MGYAEGTSVSAEKSVAEIERIVTRWKADEFGYGRSKEQAMVFFRLHGRQVRFVMPIPDPQDRKFTLTETGRKRTANAAYDAWEQKVRSKWRALAIVIKAKLVAVDEGVVTFEQEFGMHFVLPGGSTVYDQVAPQIEAAYEQGVPSMLQIGEEVMITPPRLVGDIAADWLHQAGDSVAYTVGPKSMSPYREDVPLEQCARDAIALMQDRIVHWEPGDGTSYQLTLLFRSARRFLVCTTASFPGVLPLRSENTTVGDYVRSSMPVGGWRGIRPLLVALGTTKPGGYPYDLTRRLFDQRDEAKERAKQHHTQYVNSDDEALGRQVRLLVLGESHG